MKSEAAAWKERAMEEFKLFWIIALYLFVILGAFTVYRRLIIAETGAAYLHYGIAAIEALIIAKVILIGKVLPFTRRFEDKALILSALYKSVLFGVLVLLFGIAEHLVEGWVHNQGLLGGLRAGDPGAYELGARVLTLMIAFVPFFAFWELGRVLGPHRLSALFFSGKSVDSADA
jgi:hypothetical protein